jgi:hypothetical protein
MEAEAQLMRSKHPNGVTLSRVEPASKASSGLSDPFAIAEGGAEIDPDETESDPESDVEMEKDEQEEDVTYVPSQDDDDDDDDDDDVETEDAISDTEQSTGGPPPATAPYRVFKGQVDYKQLPDRADQTTRTGLAWQGYEDQALITLCEKHGRVPLTVEHPFWKKFGVTGRSASACVNRVKQFRKEGKIVFKKRAYPKRRRGGH